MLTRLTSTIGVFILIAKLPITFHKPFSFSQIVAYKYVKERKKFAKNAKRLIPNESNLIAIHIEVDKEYTQMEV